MHIEDLFIITNERNKRFSRPAKRRIQLPIRSITQNQVLRTIHTRNLTRNQNFPIRLYCHKAITVLSDCYIANNNPPIAKDAILTAIC